MNISERVPGDLDRLRRLARRATKAEQKDRLLAVAHAPDVHRPAVGHMEELDHLVLAGGPDRVDDRRGRDEHGREGQGEVRPRAGANAGVPVVRSHHDQSTAETASSDSQTSHLSESSHGERKAKFRADRCTPTRATGSESP